MRYLTALIATVLAVAACKSDATDTSGSAAAAASGAATTAVAGDTAAAPAKAGARMGGQVVVVGAHNVELKIYDRGLVEAWVFDASGKQIADAQTKLSVRPPDGGAGVALSFDGPSMRLVGHASKEAKLPSGPLEVELSLAGGAAAKAKLEAPVLLSGPRISGALVVAGKHSVEIALSADGKIQALVRDAAGDLVDGKLKLALKVGEAEVELAWDGAAKFIGQAGAGVDFATGPVSIIIDGDVVAKLPKLAVRAESMHNGRLVAVGGYSLELVADAGALIAYVFDAKGKAHASGDLAIVLQLGSHALELAWDAPRLAYKAALAADIEIEAELTAIVKAGGEVFVGIAPPAAKAHADIDLDADASAKAKAEADIKVPTPKGKAEAGASAGKGGAKGKAKVGIGF